MACINYDCLADCNSLTMKLVDECSETLILKDSSLATSGNYVAVFTDKFQNQYYVLFTKTLNVDAEIDLTQVEIGLFNRYAGQFTMQVFDESDLDTAIDLTFDSITYKTLIISFGITENNTLK